jgi:hypothetical protein
MKPVLIAVFLLASLAVPTSAQQPTPVARTHKANLDWLFKGTQELGENDRIKATKALTPDERKAIIEAITAQYKFGRGVWNVNSEKELQDDIANTLIKLIDLNGDGIPEVIAQASDDVSCSPTGNCTIWVFMRSGNGYKLILKKGAIQTFTITSKRTNGFNDLVLGQHGSAVEQALYVYRFVDGKYRQGQCYSVRFTRLVGDEEQELDEPDITPCYVASGKKQ